MKNSLDQYMTDLSNVKKTCQVNLKHNNSSRARLRIIQRRNIEQIQ